MMRHHWSDDADEIDVVTFNHAAPIVRDVLNIEFARNFLGVFTMRAGNHDAARAFAVLEARNLGRARKARADNSDANDFVDLSVPRFRS
jgi:hypothetical protein